jgi:tight adherence protein B
MPVLAIVIFGVLFGVTMVAAGLGFRYLEAQRKKQMSTMLETVKGESPRAPSRVLVEQMKQPSALEQIAARLDLAHKVETQIQQAGLEWDIWQLLVRMAAAAAIGGLIGWKVRVLMIAGLSIPVMAVLFASLPLLYVRHKRKKRLAQFEQLFPEALDFLARALRAGHALPVSLEMLAVESSEPLKSEFKKVYNEQNLGAQLNDVLVHLGERVPLIDVRFFVAAVLMQREAGGNLGEILTKLSSVIRERFQLKGKVRAVSAHGRITAAVLTILPIGTACLLMAASPEHLMMMARESTGKYMIATALFLQIIGFLIMRRIVNIKV